MGCGMIARYAHLPCIKNTCGLELAAIYDPNPEHLRAAQEQFHVPQAFTDEAAFFASGLDAVVVTSPAPFHLHNVREAARHGLHVLCEKPLAMNDADIQQMIDLMADAKLMLFTGFCYRFSPVSMQIREMVRQGVIGEVRSQRLIYIWNLHGRYETTWTGERIESPRRVGRMLEGGPMVDCGVHQIDLARWWTGSEVVRQQAAGAWVENYEAPDHMYLHLDHESGAHTMVEMSFSYSHTASEPINHFSYHIIGTDGVIRYDRDGWHFEVRTPHGTTFYPGHDEKNFGGMYYAFAEALETGFTGDMPTGYDGLVATRIARQATESVIANRLLSPV